MLKHGCKRIGEQFVLTRVVSICFLYSEDRLTWQTGEFKHFFSLAESLEFKFIFGNKQTIRGILVFYIITGRRSTFEFTSRVNLSGPSLYCIARTLG